MAKESAMNAKEQKAADYLLDKIVSGSLAGDSDTYASALDRLMDAVVRRQESELISRKDV